jgi:nitroreductase
MTQVVEGVGANREFFDVVLGQRACRDFTGAAVSEDDLGVMLEAATRAPSAHNSQPWEFVVVQDRDVRHGIADIARGVWGAGRAVLEQQLDARLFVDVDQFLHDRDFGDAPVLLVVGVDTTKVHEAMIGCSIYPATQNLMLAAAALGYGCTFTNFTFQQNLAMAELLGLPDRIGVAGVVAIGRPRKVLGRGRREPWPTRTHRDAFGNPWTRE